MWTADGDGSGMLGSPFPPPLPDERACDPEPEASLLASFEAVRPREVERARDDVDAAGAEDDEVDSSDGST